MKKNRLIILAVLVTIFAMLLTGCTGNNEKNETTLPETEISTIQELPVTEVKETTTEKPEITTEVTTEKKSIEEVAKEVMNGEWGSGEERRKNLEKAGYDYDDVQAAVNRNVPEQENSINSGTNSNEKKEKTSVYDRDKYLSEFDWDSGELPTTPSGAFDAGAIREKTEEEMGGVVYF